MPPKTRITKELLLQTAYELTKRSGIERLTAKAIAKQLNCSVQPVYWVFETMDNLRLAVIAEATKEYNRYLLTEIPNLLKYKAIGWNYIRFAKEQPQLFRLLFMTERQSDTPIGKSDLDENKAYILSLIRNDYGVSDTVANDIYIRLWLFSHGIAAMLVTKTVSLDDREIGQMLNDVFLGLLKNVRGNEAT